MTFDDVDATIDEYGHTWFTEQCYFQGKAELDGYFVALVLLALSLGADQCAFERKICTVAKLQDDHRPDRCMQKEELTAK